MRQRINQVFILFFLLVFMTGTMGISVFEHICTCQDRTEITLFPEIFNHHSSCCCANRETELITAEHLHLCGLDNPDHCKNIKFFLKATVSPAPLVISLFSMLKFEAPENPVAADLIPVKTEFKPGPVATHCTSPPLSGRQIVISLHQSRIALPHQPRG